MTHPNLKMSYGKIKNPRFNPNRNFRSAQYRRHKKFTYPRMSKPSLVYSLPGLMILLMVLCAVGFGIGYANSEQEQTITVNRTQAVVVDGNNQYRIYCDEGVFTVEDTMIFGRWDSADVYAQLEPGRYEVTTAGWRIPIMSMFPNIVDIKRKIE